MILTDSLTKDDFLKPSLYRQIVEEVQEDYIHGNEDSYIELCMELEAVASKFRVKADFTKHCKKLCEAKLQRMKAEHAITTTGDAAPVCSYDSNVYPALQTGPLYIVTDAGIVYRGPDGESTICPMPVLPVAEYRSRETGTRKVKLIFLDKRLGGWSEVIVDAAAIANKNKVIELSAYGIPVNSCNAAHMVRYLDTIRFTNADIITIGESTHKLGWSKDNKFLPYEADNTVIYDGVGDNARLWDALSPKGKEADFVDGIRRLRKAATYELQCAMSAALASVLVKIVGVNSFCVDIYGRGGKGKTTVAKLAAAQFGDPEELVATFDFTTVGLELRKDILNSLPLILDESSSMTETMRANIEAIIYSMCNDRGRLRGTKQLGNEAARTWRNVTIITGEDAITSYLNKTGVKLRVLEIDSGNKQIFATKADAEAANKLTLNNYGWIGKQFIDTVQTLGFDKIYDSFSNHKSKLEALIDAADNSEIDKQINSMALIMTADEIATDYIYRDNRKLNYTDMVGMIASVEDVNINIRAYNDLVSLIDQNPQRFVQIMSDAPGTGKSIDYSVEVKTEQWGHKSESNNAKVYLLPLAYKNMIRSLGYNPRTFAAWLKEQGLIETDRNGNPGAAYFIDRETKRYYCITTDRIFGRDGTVQKPEEQKKEEPAQNLEEQKKEEPAPAPVQKQEAPRQMNLNDLPGFMSMPTGIVDEFPFQQ